MRRVTTPRLTANVLEREADAAADAVRTVVFVHGNVSSSLFWQPTMLDLPGDIRAIAVDLRGFGDSEPLPVDASRGVRDFSDDVASVIDELDLGAVHLVGWSMGGGVAMQLLLDRPELVASLTLQSTVSPYGFGGTPVDGSLLTPDAAGTGGGGANPDFVARLASGDRSDEPGSPRAVSLQLRRAGFVSEHEDIWVESMLSTRTGVDNYPGDATTSDRWPGFAPGTRGVLNTMAPTVFDTSGSSRWGPSRRCSGSTAPRTRSSETPRSSTSTSSARRQSSPGGRVTRSRPHSRCSCRRGRCSTASPHRAVRSRSSSSRTAVTRRTSRSPRVPGGAAGAARRLNRRATGRPTKCCRFVARARRRVRRALA